ncbi:MAG: threonine/serine exporter family protein [Planctomycetes bacterium]|nr:threonine/serine exporter family protein [Planctomycetota bacterium]
MTHDAIQVEAPKPIVDGKSDAEIFLVECAQSLHHFGAPAHVLEAEMVRTGARLGLAAQIFSLPTYLVISIGPLDRQRAFHLRVDPGSIQLGRRDEVHRIQRRVLEGDMTCAQGSQAFRELNQRPPDFGPIWQMLAYGLSAGAAARFMTGGFREVVAGAILGTLVGCLVVLSNLWRDRAAVADFVAGIVSVVGAWLLAWLFPPLATNIVVIAGVVALLPGYTLTTSLTEVATRNLASGGSRFVGAAMTLLALGFGIAIGDRILQHLPPVAQAVSEPLFPWTLLPAAGLISLAMIVILQARIRDILIILGAVLLGLYGARFGAVLVGPQLGVCIGAFVLGLAGNIFSHITKRSAIVVSAPGLIPLVPGSLGMRGATSLFQNDAASGADWAIAALVVAGSLVAGLLAANVFVPPRRTA